MQGEKDEESDGEPAKEQPDSGTKVHLVPLSLFGLTTCQLCMDYSPDFRHHSVFRDTACQSSYGKEKSERKAVGA